MCQHILIPISKHEQGCLECGSIFRTLLSDFVVRGFRVIDHRQGCEFGKCDKCPIYERCKTDERI
jgi:hypothetical protein